jgi:hypothetical protein
MHAPLHRRARHLKGPSFDTLFIAKYINAVDTESRELFPKDAIAVTRTVSYVCKHSFFYIYIYIYIYI